VVLVPPAAAFYSSASFEVPVDGVEAVPVVVPVPVVVGVVVPVPVVEEAGPVGTVILVSPLVALTVVVVVVVPVVPPVVAVAP